MGSVQYLDYGVTYLGIPVTKVKVTLEKNNSLKNINAHASSSGVAAAFFKVNNNYTTYCDSLYRPYLFKKSIVQQNLMDYKTTKFQPDEDKITVYNEFTESGLSNIPMEKPTYDLISFAFAAANCENDSSFLVISDFDIWRFNLVYLDEEYISAAEQNFICDKYQIKMKKIIDNPTEAPTDVLTNNLFGENNKLYVWYSADERRIPVMMKFKQILFSVVLKLKSIE